MIPLDDHDYISMGDLYDLIVNSVKEEQEKKANTEDQPEDLENQEQEAPNQTGSEDEAMMQVVEETGPVQTEQPPTGLDEISLCSSIEHPEEEMRGALKHIQVQRNELFFLA